MLYDVFISHAGEDKEELVRPLAEELRRRRVEVWYDEFTLRTGSSLRRAIDIGLAKSRYGVIVLSPSFFGKAWPEWELNGLVQRHLAASQNVLLPVWHRIDREAVAAYSPSLADIVAVRSEAGLDHIVDRLLRVIQPEESALVTARAMILDRGYEPPVISDDWWLDVIEGIGYQDHERWYFPVFRMSTSRGESLAWNVMQHLWQSAAEAEQITQLSHPKDILAFINQQPGLNEICTSMPNRLLEFAPQLAIPGFGGHLEGTIESAYQCSETSYELRRANNDRSGSALTTDGLSPACEDCFALRHPTFGNYDQANVACGYVIGNGGGLGPSTRAYEIFDYLVWFLSSQSDWLPRKHHAYLLQGMKDWAAWLWNGNENYSSDAGASEAAFHEWIYQEDAVIATIPPLAADDLFDRIEHSRGLLGLPESTEKLVERFLHEQIIQTWMIENERRLAGRKRRSQPQRN